MTQILTDAERKKMCEWASSATGGYTEVVGQASTILCYEATLQAKDERIAALTAQLEAESDIQYAQRSQIERLVKALRIAEWSGVAEWGVPARCPKCFIRRGKEHHTDCEIGNAIKEMTDGS